MRAEKLPYEAMFFHLGCTRRAGADQRGDAPGVRHIPTAARTLTTVARTSCGPRPTRGDLGFAGFRLHNHLNSSARTTSWVVFQGASYFRALGQGQQYGLSARRLAIDTVGGRGEEFPRFTEFWLVRPDPLSTQVTVYALLDPATRHGRLPL